LGPVSPPAHSAADLRGLGGADLEGLARVPLTGIEWVWGRFRFRVTPPQTFEVLADQTSKVSQEFHSQASSGFGAGFASESLRRRPSRSWRIRPRRSRKSSTHRRRADLGPVSPRLIPPQTFEVLADQTSKVSQEFHSQASSGFGAGFAPRPFRRRPSRSWRVRPRRSRKGSTHRSRADLGPVSPPAHSAADLRGLGGADLEGLARAPLTGVERIWGRFRPRLIPPQTFEVLAEQTSKVSQGLHSQASSGFGAGFAPGSFRRRPSRSCKAIRDHIFSTLDARVLREVPILPQLKGNVKLDESFWEVRSMVQWTSQKNSGIV